jgi:transposase
MYQLGIDIAKTKFDACLLLEDKAPHKTFGNSYDGFQELLCWLREHKTNSVHACMEGTGRLWEPLADFLHTEKFVVSVVNPARIKGFAQSDMRRSKTDKIDAKIIARFCRTQTPPAWVPPPAEIKAIRDMQRYVEELTDNKTQEKNRLQSGVLDERVHCAIIRHIEYLDNEIDALETEILELIHRYPKLSRDYDLLTSIIGVGQTAAVTFLGELSAANNFSSSRELEVFCGLTPKLFESGSSVRGKPRMSKVGNARIRKALYMPALCALRANPALREFAARLKAAGKPGKVVVGAVMRKLLRLMFAVVKTGKHFDVDFKSCRPIPITVVTVPAIATG